QFVNDSSLHSFKSYQCKGHWSVRFSCSIPVNGRVAVDISWLFEGSRLFHLDEAGWTKHSNGNVAVLALGTLRSQEPPVPLQFSTKLFPGHAGCGVFPCQDWRRLCRLQPPGLGS